jgi:autotransporter-associated beta strand protein
MAFTSDADAYTFNGTGYLGLSTTAGVSLAYGLTNTETFASSFTMGGNGGNLWLRNNSLAGGTFVIGGTLTTADNNTRYMSLDGLGGGSISGTIANLNSTNLSGLRSVGGGGTWTFTGTNTSTGGSISSGTRLDLANGATLVADYRSNNATKFASAQRVNFSGGNLTIKGNTNAATVVTLNSTELAGSLTAGSLLGFGSVLTTEKSGANALTVNLGGITRASSGLLSYLRVQGDGTLNTTQALANSILAGVFIGSDYATTNASGVVVARPDVLAYSALGTNTTGSGSTVYSISGNFTSSIAANTAVQWLGMKFNTTGAGQSYTATGNTTVNILGTSGASLLFVGADDYSINATTIGRATADNRAQTILNTGAGVLTINAALATVSSNTGRILFGGPGKTVLTTGATGNAGQVAVAEGTLSLSHNNALGSETANVYVQSGGTLELQNNITLSSANTVNLHGLGNGGNGALRNLSGTNTVAGNVVLGISGRIKAESGSSLTINGTVSAPDGETSTLILDGAGNTTLAGSIASSVTGGLNKTGSGTATLSGTNSYAGVTIVDAGALVINGSTPSGRVSVAAAGTLRGTGVIEGSLEVDGTIAPGAVSTNGTLTATATVDVPGTAQFRLFADGVNDKLLASGGSTLAGAVAVQLDAGYTNVQSGDSFDLVDGAISGTPVLSLPALSPTNLVWVTNSFLTTGEISVTNAGGGAYDSWVSYWQEEDPGFTNTLATDNPDGDPFVNSLEFAFDGNPTIGSPALLSARKSGTNAVFSYVARTNPPGSVTYQVQGTTNLSTGPWTNTTGLTISNAADQSGISLTNDYARKEFVVPAVGSGMTRIQVGIAP